MGGHFMRRTKSLLVGTSLLIAASCLATASQATVVLSDNFDTENGGLTALQYTGFTNFNVTGTGVDLVRTPDFGITCAGGSGSCVDLSGTPGPGGLISKLSYAFHAGDLVTLTFDVSGAQRGTLGNDPFDAGFDLTGTARDYTLGGTFPHVDAVPGNFGGTVESSTLANGNGFSTYSLSFRAVTDGTSQVFFETAEGGDVGPLLDNVSLDISAAPEPEAWAMLLIGLFGIGGMLRWSRLRIDSSARTA
jgi:hypothetical protein